VTSFGNKFYTKGSFQVKKARNIKASILKHQKCLKPIVRDRFGKFFYTWKINLKKTIDSDIDFDIDSNKVKIEFQMKVPTDSNKVSNKRILHYIRCHYVKI
jgi:hypothetical protein